MEIERNDLPKQVRISTLQVGDVFERGGGVCMLVAPRDSRKGDGSIFGHMRSAMCKENSWWFVYLGTGALDVTHVDILCSRLDATVVISK